MKIAGTLPTIVNFSNLTHKQLRKDSSLPPSAMPPPLASLSSLGLGYGVDDIYENSEQKLRLMRKDFARPCRRSHWRNGLRRLAATRSHWHKLQRTPLRPGPAPQQPNCPKYCSAFGRLTTKDSDKTELTSIAASCISGFIKLLFTTGRALIFFFHFSNLITAVFSRP